MSKPTPPRIPNTMPAVPEEILDRWAERQKIIRAIVRANYSVVGDRILKPLLKVEREKFLKRVGNGEAPDPIDLNKMLDAFDV